MPEREDRLPAPPKRSRVLGPGQQILLLPLRAYQIFVSEHKHYGCQFTPSCSGYSVQAIKDHGAVWGVMMTADRLIRCNPGAKHFYAPVMTDGGRKLHDPPLANFLPDPDRSQRPEFPPSIEGGKARLEEIIGAVAPKEPAWKSELETAAGEQAKLFKYALSLCAAPERDLYRAITEFKRFISYYGKHPLADDSQFMVGECYFLGARYGEAAKAYDRVAEMPHDKVYDFLPLKAALADFLGRRYMSARDRCGRIISEKLEAARPDLAKYLIFCCYVEQEKFREASEELNSFTAEYGDTWMAKSIELEPGELLKGENLPKKSRLAGGLLSTVIPGAGQLYAHRWSNALGSFILTGIFAWGSYETFQNHQNTAGYIFASVALTFYTGNIYNGVVSVTEYNEDLVQEFKVNVKEKSFFDYMSIGGDEKGNLNAGITFRF
jgi:putative membrane protein insertion efficiency factor